MRHVARALVIMTLSVAIGCSSRLNPATTPPTDATEVIEIATTRETQRLFEIVALSFNTDFPAITLLPRTDNHVALVSQLQQQQGELNYFISNHLPNDRSLWAAPIARDGVAVIVHPDNTVRNLSLESLQGIYQGHITNWRDLGGSDVPISVFTREAGNSTRLDFEQVVMGQQRVSPNVRVFSSTDSQIQQVETDVSAISFVALSSLDNRNLAIAIDGVRPTTQTIQQSVYPLRTTLYIIGQQEPRNGYRQFVGWLQSTQGQAVISTVYVLLP